MISPKIMLDYLSNKPHIGMISGFSSGLILTVQDFLFNEHTLSLVAACGVWGGAIVAGLTTILKLIELGDKLYIRYKKWKN